MKRRIERRLKNIARTKHAVIIMETIIREQNGLLF